MEPEVNINTIHAALTKINAISLATVKRRATREKWVGRQTGGKGRGGKVILYMSTMLPVDVQAALKASTLPTVKEDNLPALGVRRDQVIYKEQEEKAFAKAELALAYLTHLGKAGYGQKGKARRLFLENYNIGEAGLFPVIFRVVGPVDIKGRTIEGWVTKLKKNRWESMALVDMRGFCHKGKRSITPEQMEIILSIVRSPCNTPDKPTLEIIHQAKDMMSIRGIDTLSDSTYARWLTKDWIPRHYDQWIWWREGEKGLNDKVAYYLERDYSLIEPGDLLVADGHVLNFDIINPETQRPKRMMLILFYDVKSSYPLGWEIMPTENVDAISSALRRAILRLGKIPTAVYIDNGRAFKGKYFINKNPGEELKGLYQRLGIKYIITWAYHGQSKTIERFFRVFGQLERLAPSYVGSCIDAKPAHMNRGEKLRRKLHLKITNGATPTLEDAYIAIGQWFDKYCNTIQGPSSHIAGQSPNQVMVPGPGVDPVLLRCMMMAEDKRKIRRRGINFQKSWFYSPKLYGRTHDAFLRYDLQHKDSILVYDAETQEFICEAFKVGKVHPMISIMGSDADKAEYERQITLKKSLTKQTMSTAKEIVDTQVLPESRQRIEAAGFRLDDSQIKSVKALPEKTTPIDEDQIQKDLAELESFREDDPAEFTEAYTPEVITEESHEFSRLRELSESDRFEKLLEYEARKWILPKEHKAWMTYFEQTPEYNRHHEYFGEYRAKMVLVYGSESTGT